MRKFIQDDLFPSLLMLLLAFAVYHAFPHLKEHADKNVYTITDNNRTSKTTQGDCINGLYFVYGSGVTQVMGHDGKPVTCTAEFVKGSKFEWSELWN
jgi:hypothetical protein